MLDLFRDSPVTAIFDSLQTARLPAKDRSEGDYEAWVGTLVGVEGSVIALSFGPDGKSMAGRVSAPGIGKFRVIQREQGGFFIEQRDENSYQDTSYLPAEDSKVSAVPAFTLPAGSRSGSERMYRTLAQPPNSAPQQGEIYNIEMHFVISKDTFLEYGESGVLMNLWYEMATTNYFFARQGINIEVSVADVTFTDYSESEDTTVTPRNSKKRLKNTYLEDNNDGKLDYEDVGADLIWAIVHNVPMVCGFASIDGQYGLLDLGCELQGFAFQHELGHNLGSEHYREPGCVLATDCDRGGRYYEFSQGQCREGEFLTLMEIGDGCENEAKSRIPYYSDSTSTYDGELLGDPPKNISLGGIFTGFYEGNDNVRAFNCRAKRISLWGELPPGNAIDRIPSPCPPVR